MESRLSTPVAVAMVATARNLPVIRSRRRGRRDEEGLQGAALLLAGGEVDGRVEGAEEHHQHHDHGQRAGQHLRADLGSGWRGSSSRAAAARAGSAGSPCSASRARRRSSASSLSADRTRSSASGRAIARRIHVEAAARWAARRAPRAAAGAVGLQQRVQAAPADLLGRAAAHAATILRLPAQRRAPARGQARPAQRRPARPRAARACSRLTTHWVRPTPSSG